MMIEHRLRELFRLANRVIVLNFGLKIAEQYARPILPIIEYAYVLENGGAVVEGTAAELLDNPDVKSAYLGI